MEVVYLEERPGQDEGPFLSEERSLLNVLAQRIGEICERMATEQQLDTYRQQLRSLAVELTRSEEAVRRDFAQELHDSVGQQLALIQIRMGMLMGETSSPEAHQHVSEIRQLVSKTIKQTRTLMFEISPPVLYEQGLDAALEWLTDEVSSRYDLRVLYQVDGGATELPEEFRALLYRAVSELLANVGRHAFATQVWVTLCHMPGQARISVQDNGVGFDVAGVCERATKNGTFGLFSIRVRIGELGGTVTIDSEPGHGTKVSLLLPVPTSMPVMQRSDVQGENDEC